MLLSGDLQDILCIIILNMFINVEIWSESFL
jgi:hypothetical protein